jgi:hypothetical protein
MSRIFGHVASYIKENLNAARVLVSLLLLTLVINGSLLLAQYAPPMGFDTLTPGFDGPPSSEELGELLPNVDDILWDRPSALRPSPDGEGRSSLTVKRESRTPAEGASEALEADVTGGSQSDGSGTTAPDLRPSSASPTLSLGLPSALWEFAPDGLLERDYLREGAPDIVGGEDPQGSGGQPASEGPQGSGGPPASEDPQGSGGQPASEGPQGSGGQPANEGPQGGGEGPSHGGGGGGEGPPHGGGGGGGEGPPHGGGGGPPHGGGAR